MGKSPLDKFFVNLPPKNKRERIIRDNERKEVIYRVLKDWAYQIDKYYLISYRDLASELNNLWFAPLFINKHLHKDKIVEYHKNWALPREHIYLFRRPLNNAIKKIKGRIILRGYNTYYKIKK